MALSNVFAEVLHIPMSEVEMDDEGEINVEHLVEVINRHAAALEARNG